MKPVLSRPGVALAPRERESLGSIFFGPRLDVSADTITSAVSEGRSLLDAVDVYFSTGATEPRLTLPVYFDDLPERPVDDEEDPFEGDIDI